MTDNSSFLTILQEQYPKIVFKEKLLNDCTIISFGTPKQIEYEYFVEFSRKHKYVNIGGTLHKKLISNYFWSTGIEFKTSSDFENMYIEYVFENLNILVNFKTKITQQKSLFFQTFTLEYLEESVWKVLDKSRAFRLSNFTFPPISDKSKIYI